MSAIIYNLTVTDNKGNVIREVSHTSPSVLVMELPEIKEQAEHYLKGQKEAEEEILSARKMI